MRAGRDSRRRNRNIGTPKQGHGQDNRMTVPESASDGRLYYEQLKNPVVVSRNVWSEPMKFLVEPTSRGCMHACTPDDVVRVLEQIPWADWLGIETIVFRQPTRKQGLLKPCWGRLAYWADLGRYSGPTVFLEAQDPTRVYRWGSSLNPDDAAELERLRDDGHQVTQTKRDYIIQSSLEAIRATQLFRTIPHEVGHYVDSVTTPRNKYDSKPQQEKEAFAHRYADDLRRKLAESGRIPFERLDAGLRTGSVGLPKAWFGVG